MMEGGGGREEWEEEDATYGSACSCYSIALRPIPRYVSVAF